MNAFPQSAAWRECAGSAPKLGFGMWAEGSIRECERERTAESISVPVARNGKPMVTNLNHLRRPWMHHIAMPTTIVIPSWARDDHFISITPGTRPCAHHLGSFKVIDRQYAPSTTIFGRNAIQKVMPALCVDTMIFPYIREISYIFQNLARCEMNMWRGFC